MTSIPYSEIYREIREWFIAFVQQYDNNDPVNGPKFKHKKVHTERVCELMKELTKKEGFSEEDSWIALISARLHDTSRFEQTLRFQSYKDHENFDHGNRAVEVLKEKKVLSRLPQELQELIFVAVAWHNKLDTSLPKDLSKRENLFLNILRDADKIDNIKEEVEIRAPRYQEEIANIAKKGSPVSKKAFDSFMRNECVKYDVCNTAIDRIFLVLSWAFDLNTKSAFAMCKEHDWFSKLIDFLPEDASYIDEVRKHISTHIDENLSLKA